MASRAHVCSILSLLLLCSCQRGPKNLSAVLADSLRAALAEKPGLLVVRDSAGAYQMFPSTCAVRHAADTVWLAKDCRMVRARFGGTAQLARDELLTALLNATEYAAYSQTTFPNGATMTGTVGRLRDDLTLVVSDVVWFGSCADMSPQSNWAPWCRRAAALPN